MRQSGILMHITSLPGPWGIGSMGGPACRFIDFLKQAGQRCWQILPLNPTGYGDSPYQSCSAFAGNPYLIDLDTLVEEGLLEDRQLRQIRWCSREDAVDYEAQYTNRSDVLHSAFRKFCQEAELDAFCREHSGWLPDYALYMALKDARQGKPWYQWEEPLKKRQPDAVWQARQTLKEEIRFYCFQQYLFYKQWNALKDYAHQNGITVIGDVPIYVPLDCVDVWSNPELFQLDDTLTPLAVAGCPPDGFTEDGQLWGNPLYDWKALAGDGYNWWVRRLSHAGKLYDAVRLDHFRGFEAYWAVPYGDATARNGCWVKGPGIDFIRTVKQKLPHIRIIAEDLGFLTQEVLDLRDASGFPGMKVLEFAFDSQEPSDYLPHKYIPNTVCYTGTHDNMTLRQWLDSADADTVAYATDYMHLTEQEGLVWGVIRTAFSSVSDLCIVQMQDYLELGGEARMNFPGTQDGKNWIWRAAPDSFSHELAEKIERLVKLYDRLGE